ncbi:flagellar assembly protein FliH [Frondihabitans sp. PhB188]|uniref:FliH/SctL family protein n=1 Tax=Frondihabitans sp. PhB188 TaxID=2485200 RepID=UPI000F467114|nr:FliH/SctL family protein [Frondihabitans sp. PhB188]ROQ37344.1 flagellar assembly protein FliH [Frondihabitans sp. PhB188]
MSSFVQAAFPVLRNPITAARENEASERGHAAGYAAGLRAAAAETAALRAQLVAERDAAVAQADARSAAAAAIMVASARAIDDRQTALRTEAQETLLVTSLQLAAAILGYEVETNPSSTVIAALTRALSDVDPADVVVVRLNPSDLSLLDGQADSLGVKLVADPSLGRGDAQADLRAGFIDAALSTALARAEQALTGAQPATGGVA